MKVALKCFNRIYAPKSILKDSFTWIYVFPNELYPVYYEQYLSNTKHPRDIKDCMILHKVDLEKKEIQYWKEILEYTKNVSSYHKEFDVFNTGMVQKQYMIRDYFIKLT